MDLSGNSEASVKEIERVIKEIKEELLAMKDAFDAFAPKV